MQVWVYKHFLFLSGILLRTFTNHRTAGVGEGHSFDSSIPLPHIHRHLDISPTITAEISLWHIFRDQAQTGNHWFFSTSNLPLCHALHLLKTCLHHRYFSAHSRYFENIYVEHLSILHLMLVYFLHFWLFLTKTTSGKVHYKYFVV